MKRFRSIKSCHGEFRYLYGENEVANFASASCFEAGLLVRDLDRSQQVRVTRQSDKQGVFNSSSDLVIDAEFTVEHLPIDSPQLRRN